MRALIADGRQSEWQVRFAADMRDQPGPLDEAKATSL